MNKAFVREDAAEDFSEDEEDHHLAPLIRHGKNNYMTPAGYARMQAEFVDLLKRERPEVVSIVSWAAGNGDRSENGDYIYGKKRLREIDRRLRFLTKRLETAVVVDPAQQDNTDSVFFGATVTVYEDAGEAEFPYSIVGMDEAEPGLGRISWISPLASVLIKARLGDTVRLQAPGGLRELEIVAIEYKDLD
jgi:transcription elongation factor GreB